MRILDLALKNLSQMIRDKRSLVFLVLMPVVFTFFMGFAYRNAGTSENADPRTPLAVVDPEPGAVLNQALTARLAASDTILPTLMDKDTARQALQAGDVAGVLVIPVAFSDQALAGKVPQLTLIAETSSSQGQSLSQLLRIPVSHLMSAVEISRETVEIVGASEASAEQVLAFDLAWSKWEAHAQDSRVRLEQSVLQESSSDWTGGNPYNQSSPGILVQFAIIGLITSAQIFVQERKSRTLQRLLTTTMRPWEIVAGHSLAMFLLVFFQTVLLVVFGQLVLNVGYLSEPLGTLLVSLALGLWVAAMGLLIGVLAKGEEQVIMFSMIAMFLFSALGGTWFPLESSSGAFAAIGKLMPSAWAMTGYQNILIRGLGLESAWMPAGVLLAYAAAFFLLAVWRIRAGKLNE